MYKIPDDELELWQKAVAGNVKYSKNKKISYESGKSGKAVAKIEGDSNISNNYHYHSSHISHYNNSYNLQNKPEPENVKEVNIDISQHKDAKQIRKKFRKKNLHIDKIVDLHAMTKIEAYQYLQTVIDNAYSRGLKTLLVITGKGGKSNYEFQGVLRQNVPTWFGEEFFRSRIKNFLSADQSDGGEGAFYVFIKRKS